MVLRASSFTVIENHLGNYICACERGEEPRRKEYWGELIEILVRNMSNSDDQYTGSINLTLNINSNLDDQQSSLTSPLLNEYEVVPNHVLTKHSEEPKKSSDHTSTGNLSLSSLFAFYHEPKWAGLTCVIKIIIINSFNFITMQKVTVGTCKR